MNAVRSVISLLQARRVSSQVCRIRSLRPRYATPAIAVAPTTKTAVPLCRTIA
jgi:hypothetical protein